MTVTPKFMTTPIYFEEDAGGGGGVTPAAEAAPVTGAAPDTPASTPDPAAPAGSEAEGTEPPAGEQPPTVEDPDDGTIPETLKPYVKKLREEAAERRTALKPFEDVFSNFAPEETEVLLSVIGGLASEETQYEAAQRLKGVVDAILGDGAEDPNRPLTKADLDRIEKQKAEAAQQEQAVQAVLKEAADLGFPEGTREHRRLLDVAVNETAGDLAKAAEALKAEKDAIIADFVKEVQEGKAKWPAIVAPVGVKPADVSGSPPKSWAEARANAEARRKAAHGQ